MFSQFRQVSFVFTPERETFTLTVNPEIAVYDIVDSVVKYLSKRDLLKGNRRLILRYEGNILLSNYLFSSYNYVSGTDIEVGYDIDGLSDDNLDLALNFSCHLLNKDVTRIHSVLQDEMNNPKTLSCYLSQYLAFLYSDLITGDMVLQPQEDEEYNLSSIIEIIAHGYGGKDLLQSNNVVERSLHVLSCVFRTGSLTSLSKEEIKKFWYSLIYVLDSILGTYTDSNPNRSCDIPYYVSYYEELKLNRSECSEEEQTALTQMVEMIVYLFSYFFESPYIHLELEKPYMKDTIECLLQQYYIYPNISGMFFYNYGRAVNNSMQFNNPINNTPLSHSVARLIFKELETLTNYSLGNNDEIGIINGDNMQVSFTACYTYCLAAICSIMSQKLEQLLVKYNFRDLTIRILETCSYVSHGDGIAEEECERYKGILTCFLRLLCVITYDVNACKILTDCDYQTFLNLSTSIKHRKSESGNMESKVYQFFTRILLYCWESDLEDPIISLLMTHIFRNLTCCKQTCCILSTHNEWYNMFVNVIKDEYNRSLNNYSTFLSENVLFVPRSVHVDGKNYLLLNWLINNFLRCIINISSFEVNFLNVVTQQEFWSSCLLEYLQAIPITTSLGVTVLLFLQLVIMSEVQYNSKQFQILVNHIHSGIEDDQTEFKESSPPVSSRTRTEYELQYKQAKQLYVYVNSFLKTNVHPKWDAVHCCPIPDCEISFILQTIPLDIPSVHHYFSYLNEEFVYSVMNILSGPSLDSDLSVSYLTYLPLDVTLERMIPYYSDLEIVYSTVNGQAAKPSDTIRDLLNTDVAEIILFTAEAYHAGIRPPKSDEVYPVIGNPSILDSFKTLVKMVIETDPNSVIEHATDFDINLPDEPIVEDLVMISLSRIANRQQRVPQERGKESKLMTEAISSGEEDVDETIEPLPPTRYNTLLHGTMTLKNVESFNVIRRALPPQPTLNVIQIQENRAESKMRIKRILKKLKNSPLLERYSLILVDDAKNGLANFWYILQPIALDISDYTIGDYELVLTGCIEALPDVLKECFYEEDRDDLFLVFRYLFELCAYNTVLSLLVGEQAEAFIQCLIEFHRLCCYAPENVYIKQCLDYLLGIVENIVQDEVMIIQCLRGQVLKLFLDILQHRVITMDPYAQNLIMYIAILRQFVRYTDGNDVEPIKQEIYLVVDSVKDATCKRRLLRFLQ